MKKFYFIFLLLVSVCTDIIAQRKFRIELSTPNYISEKLLIAPTKIRFGLEELYRYQLKTSKNIIDFGQKFGFKQSSYQITIQDQNILEGEFNYPIPLSFQFYNPKTEELYFTSTFFLDSGNYKIQLPEMFNSYNVNINSEINKEYANFKNVFSDLYIFSESSRFDSLISLKEKQIRIGSYIKSNPNSYVAFWEIVNDYSWYDFNEIYLDNLKLFSNSFKSTLLFKEFEKKLTIENSTNIGSSFPTIFFDKKNALTINEFKKYKLTFIDYWSTSCIPCIKSFPRILSMFNEYKARGINFISVVDENKPQRINLAKNILLKNNIKWRNYFDTHNEFKNKLNANSYPLQFLIDETGKIVSRVTGNLDEIKNTIDEYLKK